MLTSRAKLRSSRWALRDSPRLTVLFPSKFSLLDTHLPQTHQRQLRRKKGRCKGEDTQQGSPAKPSEKALAPQCGTRLLRSLRVSPKPAQRKREKLWETAERSRYHFSLPKQFHSQLSLRCGDAVGCALLPALSRRGSARRPRPLPRAATALRAETRAALPPPPPPPLRATRATKGAQRASERGRRRLLPTPLRHSVM